MKHVDFLLGKQVKEGNVNALVISESNLHKLHKSFPDVQCRIPGFANPCGMLTFCLFQKVNCTNYTNHSPTVSVEFQVSLIHSQRSKLFGWRHNESHKTRFTI